MATDWQLKLLGYDFADKTEWGVNIEETLGQPATASFTLQDRYMADYDFTDLDPGNVGFTLSEIDTLIELDGAAMPLFRGKVLNTAVELPVAFPWRFHDVKCVDYQREVFDRRLVGTPDGSVWEGPDSDDNYVAVDPNALFGGGTDAAAVKSIFDNYAGVPAFIGTVDAETFVNEYATLGGAPYLASRAKVRAVMDHLAGQVSGNLQYWMDPALFIHWQVIPRWFEQEGPAFFLPLMLPTTPFPMEVAPFEIDNDNPDGVNSVDCRKLGWSFDYGGIVRQLYVNGGTGYKYNGGLIDRGGTGWVVFGAESAPGRNIAQDVLNAPDAVDLASKLAAAGRATNAVAEGILRGHLTVGSERYHPDGWHVGQSVKITDARMPAYLNARYYTIQKVSTSLVPGHNWRIYDIEWGDAPIARASTRRPLAVDADLDPGRVWRITGNDTAPRADSTVPIVGQLVDDKGNARRVYGVETYLELSVWDAAGSPVTGVGSISPDFVTTDTTGRWETEMTVGSQPGYRYRVDPVETPAP